MRVLFVADGRSPIAIPWLAYFAEHGYEVHLATSFPARPAVGLASLHLVPVAFSSMKAREAVRGGPRERGFIWGGGWASLRTILRQWLGLLTLPGAAARLRRVIAQVQPDLVHAMRIPYEGMLAALSLAPGIPLIVSVWGNDFTLHARSNPWMGAATRMALRRADALHVDCRRDLRLARDWGFPAGRSAVVLPGAGGVRAEVFYPPPSRCEPGQASVAPLVVNPRGFRAYMRNDTFFQAIPRVLGQAPGVRFACAGMAGERRALRWVEELDIAAEVELLPLLTQAGLGDLFRRAQVMVSPSTHDGTPNTLLEAMACGCFPIAGDLESIREWITPGVNGLLVDPGDPQVLAEAVLLALAQPDLRRRAAEINLRTIAERAEFSRVMAAAEAFYREVVG